MEKHGERFDPSMTRRSVLHIVRSLSFGGVESHMRIIALNSKLSVYDHSFCAISNGGAVADEISASGQPITILNCRSRIPSLKAIDALTRRIRIERPDVVHCHGAEANFHGTIAARLCQVPVCLTEEIGLPSHSKKARLVFRQIYRFSTSIIAISSSVKKTLI